MQLEISQSFHFHQCCLQLLSTQKYNYSVQMQIMLTALSLEMVYRSASRSQYGLIEALSNFQSMLVFAINLVKDFFHLL